MDGKKTLRGSVDRFADPRAIQVLSALSTDSTVVLDHVLISPAATNSRHEIPAAQQLIQALALADRVLTFRIRRNPGIFALLRYSMKMYHTLYIKTLSNEEPMAQYTHFPLIIRDLNFLYLQSAQQLAQDDAGVALWLGMDSETAAQAAKLTPLAIRALAVRAGIMLYQPRLTPLFLRELMHAAELAQSGDERALANLCMRAVVEVAQTIQSP